MNIIVLYLFAVSLVGSVMGQSPTMTLYTEVDQSGAAYTVTGPHSDLELDDFNDVTNSICGQGLWFLYEDRDYSSKSTFVHHFAASINTCENLDSTQWDKISSVRFAGGDDMSLQTLSLYHDAYQGGGSYLAIFDVDNLGDFNDVATSFAITGNSAWTVYEDGSFLGGGACMVPDEVDGFYYGLYDITELGLANDEVSSLRKGCHTEKLIKYIAPKNVY